MYAFTYSPNKALASSLALSSPNASLMAFASKPESMAANLLIGMGVIPVARMKSASVASEGKIACILICPYALTSLPLVRYGVRHLP